MLVLHVLPKVVTARTVHVIQLDCSKSKRTTMHIHAALIHVVVVHTVRTLAALWWLPVVVCVHYRAQ